jgi:hypothetical protein
MLLILACNGNLTLPKNTIKISSNRMHNNLILSERHYVKQQQPSGYTLLGYSETFVKLPGLTMPFYHTQPLLYKIRFEGKCLSSHSASIWLYLHLMIDDYILYVDKFSPNTANRYQYLPGYTSFESADYVGGFFWYASSPTLVTCSFNDIIYLNAGLHVVDVGVRGGADPNLGAFPTSVNNGILTIELVEYDPQADVGIFPVNVTLTSLIG